MSGGTLNLQRPNRTGAWVVGWICLSAPTVVRVNSTGGIVQSGNASTLVGIFNFRLPERDLSGFPNHDLLVPVIPSYPNDSTSNFPFAGHGHRCRYHVRYPFYRAWRVTGKRMSLASGDFLTVIRPGTTTAPSTAVPVKGI